LTLKLFFVRSLGYYIIQIYIPSTLIVVLSWVSFWLDRTAAPARVSLGITTVLTMVTFIWSTNASLPKISYVKGIDVYLVCCFFMTFSSVIEYAMVSYVHMRFERKKRKKNALLQEVQQQNELSKQLMLMRNSSAQLNSSNSALVLSKMANNDNEMSSGCEGNMDANYEGGSSNSGGGRPSLAAQHTLNQPPQPLPPQPSPYIRSQSEHFQHHLQHQQQPSTSCYDGNQRLYANGVKTYNIPGSSQHHTPYHQHHSQQQQQHEISCHHYPHYNNQHGAQSSGGGGGYSQHIGHAQQQYQQCCDHCDRNSPVHWDSKKFFYEPSSDSGNTIKDGMGPSGSASGGGDRNGYVDIKSIPITYEKSKCGCHCNCKY
jgi:hypothetical protein